MALDQELIDLMLDVVVLEPQTGIDKFNNFTFGSPVACRCQIVRMNKRALTVQGRELMSTVQVILADPTLVVSENDRLTLSDGTRPGIVQVLAAKDDVGPYYLEIRA